MEYRVIQDHNRRANAIWSVVSQSVDFAGRSVVDLGCGHGDMLWRLRRAGAVSVSGIEKDFDTAADARRRVAQVMRPDLGEQVSVSIVEGDIESFNFRWPGVHDVNMCFSVLPYLTDPGNTLRWMSLHAPVSLIEMQYFGDGPGPKHVKDDGDMRAWLDKWWDSVGKVGETFIKGRDATRSIWRCRDPKERRGLYEQVN